MKSLFILTGLFLFILNTACAKQFIIDTSRVSSINVTALDRYHAVCSISKGTLNTLNGTLYCSAPVSSLRFGPNRIFYASTTLDHFFKGYLECDQYPDVVFEGKITNLKEIHFDRNGSYVAHASGTLTAHGRSIQKDLTITLRVYGDRLELRAACEVAPADDFHIRADTPPKKTIFKKIAVNITAVLKEQ